MTIDQPADAQPERVLAQAVIDKLFVNAWGQQAHRLVLTTADGHDLGGGGRGPALDAVALVLKEALLVGLPDDGGVAETARRHSAKCREQEAQRTREAEALLAGLPGEGAQPTDENIQTIANLAWSGFDSSKACKEIYAICRDSLDVTFRSQRRRNGS